MNVSRSMACRMIAKGLWNLYRRYPLSVSFEVTHACTANCWHCNLGGPIRETRRSPEEYARIAHDLSPLIVHLSGGEPLVRGDIEDIVRAVSRPGRLPWVVVVSNSSQLTPAKFLRLKQAGMHQLSVSIDFPDDRHDQFRRIPGLFDRMSRVLPECSRLGDAEDVTLNCCITHWNYRDLTEVARTAQRWGVSINFSAYTPNRTDDARGMFLDDESRVGLRREIDRLIELKRSGLRIFTSEGAFERMYEFLTTGFTPHCQAGYRFLVINPDGRLTPCAMVMAYFDDHRTMQREFSRVNQCGSCYVSTRANTEKTLSQFLWDNRSALRHRNHRHAPDA